MSSMKLGYDLSPVIYSPNGRLFQQEYCANAIREAPTINSALLNDGLIIAISENRQTISQEYDILDSKAYILENNLVICSNGIVGDSDYVMERIRKEIIIRKEVFSESLELNAIFNTLCSLFHLHGSFWHLRPLACSFLVNGISEKGPEILLTSNLGVHNGCFAVSIGKNSDGWVKILNQIVRQGKTTRESFEFLIQSKETLPLFSHHPRPFLFILSPEQKCFHHPSTNLERGLNRASTEKTFYDY